MNKTIATFVQSRQHKFSDHPERPARFEKINRARDDVTWLEFTPAEREEILRVHHPKMLESLELACEEGDGIIDYAPTYVTKTSFADALLAAGGVLACTRAVLNNTTQNAFAIVRPPGHHAEPPRAMGFCIFNNVAVAAQDAIAQGATRVMVIDYDAHHGNGTQAAALHDERFAFLSSHQEHIYPGTGAIEDAPHAKKRIVNVPLPARSGDKCFIQMAQKIYEPFIENFKPEILFVSAGFDSHWNDPLTTLGLSSAGFYQLSKYLVDLAARHCNGKIVFVMEGGYNPANVANGVEAVFAALTGSGWNDPRDPSPHKEPDINPRLDAILKWHGFA